MSRGAFLSGGTYCLLYLCEVRAIIEGEMNRPLWQRAKFRSISIFVAKLETLMQKRLLWIFILIIALIPAAPLPDGSLVRAQGPWPPVDIQLKPTITGNRITFEITATNLVDWDLADFVPKVETPVGTTFVEGHGDFSGASVTFDGQEVTFSIVKLPLRAVLGYRYTVELAPGVTQIYSPEMWISWKGRLPGQYLFASDHQPINLTPTPTAQVSSTDNLSRAALSDLPVINVWGGAYEQGLARGQILQQEVVEQVNAELSFILPQAYEGSHTKWLEAIHTQITQIAPDVLEELRGIADGSGVDLDDLEIINFASYVAPPDTPLGNGIACYVLAASGSATTSRSLIIGRHQDLRDQTTRPVFIVRHFSNINSPRIDITLPASMGIFASVTAGGLFLEPHPVIGQGPVPAGATDTMSLIRESLDKAQTLDSLQQLLISQNRIQAANMTIADLSKNEVRTLELSYTQSAVVLPDAEGLLISTNRYVATDLQSLQPQATNQPLTYRSRLLELAHANRGQITPETLQTYLHDPQIWNDAGLSLVVDADQMTLAYWDQFNRKWITLSLKDVLGTTNMSSTSQP